ncbi:uncharacterized protein LOC131256922 [Magnolia sinica]|uniref:uncharacterized protein LOC131256922 n=1 Tax=Magnolia sinica TaxID=86752 RepID=UPI002659FDCC|nr:uncharacterized protein LOC131256922 [Magnolia sinica]XP_058114008.1 uncharacterized protein LOC131256922 [Magnolia sinica]XP_058114009.1 uncharacterized protein LOC131256922 [Magnolia sinica]XP_058114011.1 uncharacterized protein LOC131256922 [Magnolia sinica]
MAETSLCSATIITDISGLKEALLNQQKVIQNLYFELEEEREASASAASEVLSMILRVQGERAAEKMEAHQYKRMTEEKIQHAEESLALFEELVYRKEMEIASLEFQVQAYKHKFLSMGFSDLDFRETEFPENPFLCKNDVDFDKTKTSGATRRATSLPIIPSKGSYSRKQYVERGSSSQRTNEGNDHEFEVQCETAGPTNCLIRKADHADYNGTHEEMQNVSEESVTEDYNSCRKQIEQVKELSHTKSADEGIESEWVLANKELQSTIAAYSTSLMAGSHSCLWHSAASSDQLYDSTSGVKEIKLNSTAEFSCSSSQAEDSENVPDFNVHTSACLKTETVENTYNSANVHDIFEVPQNQAAQYPTSEGENRIEKPDSTPLETIKYDFFKDEAQWVKKALISTHEENVKKALIYAHQDEKLSTQWNGATTDCHWPLTIDPETCNSPSQAEVEQLNKRLQLLEDERQLMKQEASDRRKEEMKLLGEICEQIKGIESHLKSQKAKKHPKQDDSSLAFFMEAMLSFSI